ncbi:hypothetical protein N7528_002665 [Penicillium herquei]|nr:hypothetical protein N7528_002665 [Penicillium herquei]
MPKLKMFPPTAFRPREIWFRLSSVDLNPWRPQNSWPLIQCLLISTPFLVHMSGDHIEDYSNVSGYFGPGAFWAWIITCISAVFPTAGPALSELVWGNPHPLPGYQCNISMIPPIPRPEGVSDHTQDVRQPENPVQDDDKLSDDHNNLIDDRKLGTVRAVLELLFHRHPDMESSLPMKEFLSEMAKSYPESRSLGPAQCGPATLCYRAELVLNMMPSILKQFSSQHRGFVEYTLLRERDLNGGLEIGTPLALASQRLVDDISTEFIWFSMSNKDFIIHLLELRNRANFLVYRHNARRISKSLDPTTCTAALYPLVASVSPIMRHARPGGHPWSASDEAAASVAQIALGFSGIAIIAEYSNDQAVSVRLWTWFLVGGFSQIILSLRICSMSLDYLPALILGAHHICGIYIVLLLPIIYFGLISIVASVLRVFPRFFNPISKRIKLNTATQTAIHACILLIMVLLPVRMGTLIGRGKHRSEDDIWRVHFGVPAPNSSATISDLDQASSLGVALVLFVLYPLQWLLSYAWRAFWNVVAWSFKQLWQRVKGALEICITSYTRDI